VYLFARPDPRPFQIPCEVAREFVVSAYLGTFRQLWDSSTLPHDKRGGEPGSGPPKQNNINRVVELRCMMVSHYLKEDCHY
jgi:hypothetical protein